MPGKPLAAFVCPGHPLLDATIDLILERNRDLLKRGAVLVDTNDDSETVRALFYLEHSIQDAAPSPPPLSCAERGMAGGRGRRVVSRQMQFVEIDDADRHTWQAMRRILTIDRQLPMSRRWSSRCWKRSG